MVYLLLAIHYRRYSGGHLKIQIVYNMKLCVGRVENYTTNIREDFFDALDEVLDDMGYLKTVGRNMGEIRNECKNLALFLQG